MAIPRGHRFAIEFDNAFPQGLVLIGDVTPDNEYQTREDKAAGRPVRQKLDQVTGQRQWKATVTDPDEPNAAAGSSLRDLMARMGHDSPRAAMIYQHATNTADQLIADGLSLLIEQHRRDGHSGHAEGTNDEENNACGGNSLPNAMDELR